METDTTAALQREATDLAATDEIAPHSARRIAKAHGVSFQQLLKLGAMLLLLVRMARSLLSGAPVVQAFNLFGIRWKLTLEREAN